MHLILCDLHRIMTAAWADAFAGCEDVEVRQGDLTDLAADAYVSPANSFGQMDGGIDWALRERFGHRIEDRVQAAIARQGGMLPVGKALIVETDDDEVPYLVVAPTMEVPSVVSGTDYAYLAMRALLGAVGEFEAERPGEIETVAVPGLCTGVGRMEPRVAADQMRRAYDEFNQR
jgi:O-acetyl-ADP-ribose deacetylase (regulator of RNase III)